MEVTYAFNLCLLLLHLDSISCEESDSSHSNSNAIPIDSEEFTLDNENGLSSDLSLVEVNNTNGNASLPTAASSSLSSIKSSNTSTKVTIDKEALGTTASTRPTSTSSSIKPTTTTRTSTTLSTSTKALGNEIDESSVRQNYQEQYPSSNAERTDKDVIYMANNISSGEKSFKEEQFNTTSKPSTKSVVTEKLVKESTEFKTVSVIESTEKTDTGHTQFKQSTDEPTPSISDASINTIQPTRIFGLKSSTTRTKAGEINAISKKQLNGRMKNVSANTDNTTMPPITTTSSSVSRTITSPGTSKENTTKIMEVTSTEINHLVNETLIEKSIWTGSKTTVLPKVSVSNFAKTTEATLPNTTSTKTIGSSSKNPQSSTTNLRTYQQKEIPATKMTASPKVDEKSKVTLENVDIPSLKGLNKEVKESLVTTGEPKKESVKPTHSLVNKSMITTEKVSIASKSTALPTKMIKTENFTTSKPTRDSSRSATSIISTKKISSSVKPSTTIELTSGKERSIVSTPVTPSTKLGMATSSEVELVQAKKTLTGPVLTQSTTKGIASEKKTSYTYQPTEKPRTDLVEKILKVSTVSEVEEALQTTHGHVDTSKISPSAQVVTRILPTTQTPSTNEGKHTTKKNGCLDLTKLPGWALVLVVAHLLVVVYLMIDGVLGVCCKVGFIYTLHDSFCRDFFLLGNEEKNHNQAISYKAGHEIPLFLSAAACELEPTDSCKLLFHKDGVNR